jgi:hypothetical protein
MLDVRMTHWREEPTKGEVQRANESAAELLQSSLADLT